MTMAADPRQDVAAATRAWAEAPSLLLRADRVIE
jgi:hypothetical protein